MVSKFAYFVELRIGYQPVQFQYCRLSGSTLQSVVKIQRWCHQDVITCCLGLKFVYFMKLNKGYQPVKFQISWLSGSNFMEVGIRHQKDYYDVVMIIS